jgi:hypothetical protein
MNLVEKSGNDDMVLGISVKSLNAIFSMQIFSTDYVFAPLH